MNNTLKTNTTHSPIISSHYSLDSPSAIMKSDDYQQSSPSSELTSDDGVDIDLRGIPSFILDLQHKQPTLNIMTCGDVSHGKSTLLKALSGEKTGKHSQEVKGNMTIRLGYTSCKIWKCKLCPPLQCYFSTHSDLAIKRVACNACGARQDNILLLRHISFVDVPGHAQLMQTMVSATSVADAAILVIDASKPCPGKQTAQHMDAIHLLGLVKQNQLLIAQNKIDLVSPPRACQSYEEITRYLSGFGEDSLTYNTPIIPISAQSKLNIDALCHRIIHHLPPFSSKLVARHKKEDLHLNIIRSFDVNRAKDLSSPQAVDGMVGGVLGGAVLHGHISIGQMIEIRPGYIIKKKLKKYKSKIDCKLQPQWEVQPIITKVKSLQYGRNNACGGYPGGNVGVETNIDPSLTKSDRMCGHVMIDVNHPNPPPIFNKCVVSYSFLSTLNKPFKKLESIRVNIGSFKMKAEVVKHDAGAYNGILLVLEAPICARIGDKVGICRQNNKKEWAFVGGAIIRKTKNISIGTDKDPFRMTHHTKHNNDKRMVDNHHNIHLSYQQRNGRKGVTIIVGLPVKLNLNKLITKMKKKWSTGATIVQHKEKGDVIQIQGDLRRSIYEFLISLDIAQKSQITIHGY
eukprot:71044_1